MLDLIIDYLTALGYGGLLAGVVVESMGIPLFPGGIMVILAGFLINQGKMNFISALFIMFTGYTAGSLAAYLIGRKVGKPLFQHSFKFLHISPARLEQTQNMLDRSAPVFIVFGRFLPGLSNLTPYLAGISRINIGYFIIFNSIFALSWGTLYLLIGMFFGHNYQVIAGHLNRNLPLAGLLILLLYFLYPHLKALIYKKIKNT
ncbi:MAG: Inner membrane protein YabI [Pelotomaculum sp. PtaB.Bin104]|nr:MAG: Inner membrane protein YabI [Pelotomaculum sp. PtaB.Bin104]